jgi:spermidine synthase
MKILPILFSLTLFCAAFLSFAIQPILGKIMLPMVGGAPAGWIVAMAFFQIALLAGYGVSYLLGRLNPWIHAAGLITLYVMGFAFLPPQLPAFSDQGSHLSIAVIVALSQTILVPFLALTATTAALQRIFAATSHPTANDPYYLFVASNLGSFAGLLIYPFLLEPLTGLKWQSSHWAIIYGVTVVLILVCCAIAALYRQRNRLDIIHSESEQDNARISLRQMAYWVVLAFIPCSLSMGATTLITTDMPGIPLFWILPLGLYLLTFILAFAQKPILTMKKLRGWQINAIGFWILALALGFGFRPTGNMIMFAGFVVLLMEVFFINAWTCHRELAALRPETSKLPLYYFMLALGGGLAGIMHAFILPFVLKDVIEFPIIVFLCLILHPEFRQEVITPRLAKLKKLFVWIAPLCFITAIIVFVMRYQGMSGVVYMVTLAIFSISFLMISARPRLLLATGILVLISCVITRVPGTVIETGRNFFGSWFVYEQKDQSALNRYFVHGVTVHGVEPMDKTDAINRYHSTYYARGNSVADVLKIANAKNWAVVGLGSGQLACYDPKLTTDFYEIDPDVESIAQFHFTYLNECPPRDVVIGDGRLKLEQTNYRYDVILLDAFTSDAIPLHLLTKEALAIYKQRLNKNGVMLFHISNRYLELGSFIAAAAKENGLPSLFQISQKDKKYPLMQLSKWVAVPLTQQAAQSLSAKGWETLEPAGRAWTDDRSSVLEAFTLNPRLE